MERSKKQVSEKPSRPLGVYLTILWTVVAIAFLCAVFVTATALYFHPINVVVLVLEAIAIVGLWLMRRWGAALMIVVWSIIMGFSMYNLHVAYAYPQMIGGAFTDMFWLTVRQSIVGLVAGTLIVLYLFKSVFKGVFH